MTTWALISAAAKNAGAKFPDCVSAQWALESGYGKHTSGKNNFFGIKGTPGTTVSTQEYVNGQFVTIQDTFKDFSSPEECVQYLVDRWYKDYKGYQGVNRADSRDECARLLVAEGYATDPDYASKLIELMNENAPASAPPATTGCFLIDAAAYYKAEPHQDAAWRALQAELSPDTLERFKTAYRASQAPVAGDKPKFPLAVPYFWQRDSKTGQGERVCFSSSMAMAIEYLNPDALAGDDDDYLKVVLRYGDTVSSDAQIKAARSLGMDVNFRTNCSEQDLIKQLDKGIPVPVGILHKGSIDHPTGGGHWVCLIGYDSNNFMVHDPYGELDLVNGGYPKAGPTDGKNQRYSRKNLMRRWLIANDHDGWACMFK